MLCAPVFIFTSGYSAILGSPRCVLFIFATCHIQYTFFFFLRENGQSTKILEVRQNGRRRLLGAQSINTERALSELSNPFVRVFAWIQKLAVDISKRHEMSRRLPKLFESDRVASRARGIRNKIWRENSSQRCSFQQCKHGDRTRNNSLLYGRRLLWFGIQNNKL